MRSPIPFNDLSRAVRRELAGLEEGFQSVLSRGRFILGDATRQFEKEFAGFAGALHAVGCASGTDAITLALMGLGIEPGDEVITVSMTCAPTATGIVRAGAVPVFVDVDEDTLTLDPQKLEEAVSKRTKAILPVHLYGQPAPMKDIVAFARARGLLVVEDCAQAHGGSIEGRPLGSFGDAAAWSFYPTKNLGALGDGGMVTTADAETAARIRRLRVYGYQSRNDATEIGFNSRLDELQAAILLFRLHQFEERQARRRNLAGIYFSRLEGRVRLPARREGEVSAHHLFVIRIKDRDQFRERIAAQGISTDVHYPRGVHQQLAFAGFAHSALPVTEKAVQEIVSLPLFPELEEDEALRVVREILDAL